MTRIPSSTCRLRCRVGRPRLRFMLETEERLGFSCIGLARVVEVQADRRVVVDDRFIPPCLRASAAPPLANLIGELVGMLGSAPRRWRRG